MEPGMKTPSENMCITRCHLQQLEGTILRISQRKWLVSTLEGKGQMITAGRQRRCLARTQRRE